MCTQTWSVKLILILIRNIFIFLQKCSSHAYFKGAAFSVLAESLDFIFFPSMSVAQLAGLHLHMQMLSQTVCD